MFLDELTNSLHHSIYRYPEVLKYLKSREVTDEDIKAYHIGYGKVVRAPAEVSIDHDNFMDECWRGKKLENKVVFPFKDALGNTIGLVGRSIESKEFKVFVTEEAKFKGFFFGLFQALPHMYRTKKVFIVEGCFDQLALAKVFPNTVATLTAGLSDAQYDLLMMYCEKIITVFDSDKAGWYGKKEAMQRPNVVGADLGYKDPAKYLEEVKLKKFRIATMKRMTGIEGI
jgi:DNA primase